VLLSGFTAVRNAQIMGYPVVEAIRSILPIVDEYVVGVGQGDDGTREMIAAIGDPKVRIFDSHWDTAKQSGGYILADKTNEALDHCRGDWCFYLQADEIVHENDLETIRAACLEHRDDRRVEGLLFRYIHFYGSYSVVAASRGWYRQEVRIVRRDSGIRSVGDAQSFMVGDRKARVRWSGGTIHHYGHVKPPQQMGEKHKHMHRWYHGSRYDHAFENFRFRQIYGLRPFTGSHPEVMRELVAAQDWSFEPRFTLRDWNRKDYKNVISDVLEKLLRRRLGERKKFELLER
jgi:glycosyltransferase involved in cell wall biosynthesis